MAKPGFWRNVGGAIVNGVLSPGTTPYGPNGQYNKTLLRNGFINLGAGAVNPLAGQLSQLATSRLGGGMAQEAGQKGWGWLADQSISPDGMPVLQQGFGVSGMQIPGQPMQGQEAAQPQQPQQAPSGYSQQPSQLAQLQVGGPRRDSRSGASAGSSVLAQGKAAQDMVEGMQLSSWLNSRSPYKFRGTA